MTLTRHSLIKCRTKDCPFTPDQHDEWMELCSKAPEHGHRHDQPTHQHHPKKGMGGNNPKSKIVAVLCWPFHDRIDNGTDWGNAIVPKGDGTLVYWAFDLHGNTLIEREVVPDAARQPKQFDQREVGREGQVLSAAAEGSAVNDPAKDKEYLAGISASPSAAAPSAPVLSDGGEDAPPQGAEVPTSPPSPPSPSAGSEWDDSLRGYNQSPPSTKEESDADGRNRTRNQEGVSDGQGDRSTEEAALATLAVGDRRSDAGAEHRPSSLTHEQRVAVAQAIKDTEWNRQWFAGDTGNLWIEQLGESAEQYLSDFGYQPESLANILRVCAKIPPAYRNGNLRFSHHVVVAGENLEDVEMHLAECEEEQWSVSEFRRQRKGTKPRVKRYSLEELREQVGEFENDVGDKDNARDFLDYLEGQA